MDPSTTSAISRIRSGTDCSVNEAGVGAKARINDKGNGILLYDTTGSSTAFSVNDTSSGSTAADLAIAGSSSQKTVGGATKWAIDGVGGSKIDITATDTLSMVVDKINASKSGVKAALVKDPMGRTPYRITLTGVSGEGGRFIVGSAGLPFSFKTTAEGRDALLQVGTGRNSTLVTSDLNVVQDVVPGLTVSLKAIPISPIAVTVERNAAAINSAVQQFVDQYNKFQDKLARYTSYDVSSNTKGALFGTTEVLRLENDLGRLMTKRFSTTGNLQSLASLGVSVSGDGKLTLDASRLKSTYDADPDGVAKFFADMDKGFGKQADALIETLVGKNSSVLVNRSATLQKRYDDFQVQINHWTGRLSTKRDRLLNQFYSLELAVSKIQSGYNSISSSLTNAVNTARQSNSRTS